MYGLLRDELGTRVRVGRASSASGGQTFCHPSSFIQVQPLSSLVLAHPSLNAQCQSTSVDRCICGVAVMESSLSTGTRRRSYERTCALLPAVVWSAHALPFACELAWAVARPATASCVWSSTACARTARLCSASCRAWRHAALRPPALQPLALVGSSLLAATRRDSSLLVAGLSGGALCLSRL